MTATLTANECTQRANARAHSFMSFARMYLRNEDLTDAEKIAYLRQRLKKSDEQMLQDEARFEG